MVIVGMLSVGFGFGWMLALHQEVSKLRSQFRAVLVALAPAENCHPQTVETPEAVANALKYPKPFWWWVKEHGAAKVLQRMWSNMNAENPDKAWWDMYEHEMMQDSVPGKIKEWVSWLYMFKMRPSLAGSQDPMFMPDGFGPELIDMVKWVEDNYPKTCAIEECEETDLVANYGCCETHADEYGAYES